MFSTTHFHPMLVHFPIALIMLGFLAEFLSFFTKKELCFSKVAYYLLLFGTVSSLLAWLTGLLFTSEMSGSAGEVKSLHEIFAWTTLGLALLTSILKIWANQNKNTQTKLSWISSGLYALTALAVTITGYLGGNLVYNYMMPL